MSIHVKHTLNTSRIYAISVPFMPFVHFDNIVYFLSTSEFPRWPSSGTQHKGTGGPSAGPWAIQKELNFTSHTTSKKLLGTKGIATRSKNATSIPAIEHSMRPYAAMFAALSCKSGAS